MIQQSDYVTLRIYFEECGYEDVIILEIDAKKALAQYEAYVHGETNVASVQVEGHFKILLDYVIAMFVL